MVLPARVNIVLGGCRACSLDALVNDIGLVARLRDGEPGYQLWAGGSLGRQPRLSLLLRPFLPRQEVWPAVWSVVEWFCHEGQRDQMARGRLTSLIEEKGEAAFRQAFTRRLARHRPTPQPPLPAVEVASPAALEAALALAPAGGWSGGVRPERRPGYASITVRVPVGDILVDDLEQIADLAPEGLVHLTRDQNLLLRSVPVDDVSAIVDALAQLGLGPSGARGSVDVRACSGLPLCSLAVTDSQSMALAVEAALGRRPDLPRDVSIAVSACASSCARQQVADIGLVGGPLSDTGADARYRLSLGADLAAGQIGRSVLEIEEEEAPAAVIAALETWVAVRRPGEPIGIAFRRVGLERVAAAVSLRLRSEPGRRPA